ncbi:unnamed protein product [Phytophthora lilii]|uniref:Unnamed protein product n=1 Tax=Phytophthora lilii TaxID=2077276 RepID=A0A9W6U8T5_9STRA|nr:unnamed protein product [Phytophthora lilii]
MTQDVDSVGTNGGTANGTSGGGSSHPPLFDSPSKYGIHHTIATYMPTEQRFRWQAGAGATDALYSIPTSIGTGPKKSFGNSTRDDWDVARKRVDPGAGPGSYEPAMSCGKQASSECRSSGSTAFENAPRTPHQENTTPSPGPIYDLPPVMGRGSPAPKQGTSLRPPLNGKSIGPGPNLMLKGSFRDCRPLFLGEGATAQVYLAEHEASGAHVAIKVIDKLLVQRSQLESKVQQEMVLHAELQHPHVLHVESVFEDARNYYMVLEYCARGSLSTVVKKLAGRRMDEQTAERIFRQVVTGVVYLHASGVIHRDLKLANLLLNADGEVKISDFGLAARLG